MKTITKDSFEEQAKIGLTALGIIMNEEFETLTHSLALITKEIIQMYGVKVQLKDGIYTGSDGRKTELDLSSNDIIVYQHDDYIIVRDSEYKELIGGIVHCQNFIFAI